MCQLSMTISIQAAYNCEKNFTQQDGPKHKLLGKKASFSQFLFSLILWETNHFIAMVTINTDYL